jgi:hypothetical protein
MRSIWLWFGLLALVVASPITTVSDDDDGAAEDDSDSQEVDVMPEQPLAEAGVPTRSPAQETQGTVVKAAIPAGGPVQETVAPVPASVNMVASENTLQSFGTHEHMHIKSFGRKHAEADVHKLAEKDDANKAHSAAQSAKKAASEANAVTKSSVHLADNARSALNKAHDAIHNARVDTAGLSSGQKRSLKAAEAKLKEATKKAEYGQLKTAKYVTAKVDNKKLAKMEEKMEKIKKSESKTKSFQGSNDEELEAMRAEIKDLREEVKKKEGDKADDAEMLKDLQDQIEQMEKEERKEDHKDTKSHDEMKAEIEKLRVQIKEMEENDDDKVVYEIPPAKETPKQEVVEKYDVEMKPLDEASPKEEVQQQAETEEVTPVQEKGIDIDTAMPYGDLEPFGREDTAQELTENSIKESDGMVDQLERAEVSEEKRAVFRALTRLRGAAITSFDGVARSQTGNIDEYNKIHKWRESHPLHHLADEESDISKWAFPDNAD